MRSPYPLLLTLLVAACTGRSPGSNWRDGKLTPCPATPNCVSTEATDDVHRMPPIPFPDSPQQAQARIAAALRAEPRLRLVEERPGYLRAEARSLVFRFVDDIDVVIDAEAGLIRFRSASRLGRNDWGVNRARLERVSRRAQFLHSPTS